VDVAGDQRLDVAPVANVLAARRVNEAIRAGRLDGGAAASVVCECGALGCHAVVELAQADYEAARADPRRFIVVPGHQRAEDELVAAAERYAIVAKRGAAGALAADADPRATVPPPASYRVPTLSFAFPAAAEAVPRARHWIGEFVTAHTADADLRCRSELAFTEAFTNAVRHAYGPGEPGRIDVAADVEDRTLEIVVIDHGRGLTASQSHGLGAGLAIVARSADEFAVRERAPTGTEVWLRFALDPTVIQMTDR
jgi:anti-sigma regulatory factor (Ser/Thr protein kinase)